VITTPEGDAGAGAASHQLALRAALGTLPSVRAAVLSSLYPALTIVLARLLVGERLTAVRLAGLSLAAASVALIAVGRPLTTPPQVRE
jgi:drug/metabolite transporter (DMT)-like permease